MWKVIESYTRTDANGYVHLVTKSEPDPDAGWVLRITGVAKDFDFATASEAQGFSQEWEDKITKDRAEEAAEAAKWPKMGTKTIRRQSWTPDKKIELELKKYQPKFGEQRVGVYLDGELLGVTLQDLHGAKEPWKYLTADEIKDERRTGLHWRRYGSQADAIRNLIDAYERKTGKFI